jgi:hypothetical protein
MPRHRWRQFIKDCHTFLNSLENWPKRAIELGWDGLALFGCHRDQPLMYLSSAGLLWAINGGRLKTLHRDWATYETAGGAEQVFHRRRPDARVFVVPWLLRAKRSDERP